MFFIQRSLIKMKKYLLLLIILVLSGCATIFAPPSNLIHIVTEPAGIPFKVRCYAGCSHYYEKASGVTPQFISLSSKNKSYIITFTHEGEDTEVKVSRELNQATLLNILGLYLYLIAYPLDYIAGTAYKMPSTVHLKLSTDSNKDTILK